MEEEKEKFRFQVGQVIRAIRKENNHSQAKVASLLGKDQGQISRIERGMEDIRISEVNQFCDYFGIAFADFAHKLKRSPTVYRSPSH